MLSFSIFNSLLLFEFGFNILLNTSHVDFMLCIVASNFSLKYLDLVVLKKDITFFDNDCTIESKAHLQEKVGVETCDDKGGLYDPNITNFL